MIAVIRQEPKRRAQGLLNLLTIPEIRVPDRDDEMQISPPFMSKGINILFSPRNGLVRAVHVGGNLEQILEGIRHVLAHLFVDVFDA